MSSLSQQESWQLLVFSLGAASGITSDSEAGTGGPQQSSPIVEVSVCFPSNFCGFEVLKLSFSEIVSACPFLSECNRIGGSQREEILVNLFPALD